MGFSGANVQIIILFATVNPANALKEMVKINVRQMLIALRKTSLQRITLNLQPAVIAQEYKVLV
jgi:hypothetical protein